MRSRFDEQLEQLNVELTNMGALCEQAISVAIKSLTENKDEYAEQVFKTDGEIDQMEREIEALCLKLLLQQQPVAKDLRAISSALKMISDLERIGDQASDIAEITKYIGDAGEISRVHIADMARAAVKMVTDSVESYVNKDLKMAYAVMKYDDIVDELFCVVKNELIKLISEDNSRGETCIDLLMIAKYLERIGDHAVNVAEWVEFSITGHHKDAEIQ